MRFSILSTVVFVVESLILSTFAQVTPITDFPDYKTARGCVQSAASWGLYVYGIDDLGCGQQQSQTCLCGAIGSVSAQINDYIYTYASSGCGDTIEASSAAGIFHAYCTTSAVEPAAATSMVSTSIDVENFLTTAGASPESTPTNPVATSTSSSSGSSANGNNNGGSSTNNINIKTGGASQTHSNPTSIIVGTTVTSLFLGALGFLCWFILRRRRTRSQNRREADGRAARDRNFARGAVESKQRNESWEQSYHGYALKREDLLNKVVELPGNPFHENHEPQSARPVYELWGR